MITIANRKKTESGRKGSAAKKPLFISYLRSQFLLFINSFKSVGISGIYSMLIDMLFYSIVIAVFFGLGKMLESVAPADITPDSVQALGALTDNMSAFLNYSIAGLIAFVLVAFSLWIVSRLLVWRMTIKGELSARGIWKFSLVALVFSAVFTALFVLPLNAYSGILQQNNPLSLALILVLPLLAAFFACLQSMSFISFVIQKEPRFLATLKDAFITGISNIHRLLLPLLLISLAFIATSAVSRIFGFLPQTLTTFMTMLALLAFMMWARHYFADVVKSFWPVKRTGR